MRNHRAVARATETAFAPWNKRKAVGLWGLAVTDSKIIAAVISRGAVRWLNVLFHTTGTQCSWKRATKESGFSPADTSSGRSRAWWVTACGEQLPGVTAHGGEKDKNGRLSGLSGGICTIYLHRSEKLLSKICRNILHTFYWKELKKQTNSKSVSLKCTALNLTPRQRRRVVLPTATRSSSRFPDISLSMLSCRVFLLMFLYSTRATNTHQRQPYLLAVSVKQHL